MAKETNSYLIDLEKEFERKIYPDIPGEKYFYDWCHLNKRGAKIVGEAIAEKILELKLLEEAK